MADNIAITAGSGTTVAADDIGSVFYQRVKVSVGADGSATDVSATNPLSVVGLGGKSISATLTVTNGAYAVADVAGGLIMLLLGAAVVAIVLIVSCMVR